MATVVRLPEHMVTRALATAPKRMTLYDRHGKATIFAGGYDTYYGGGSDCLNILDHRHGQAAQTGAAGCG
jgi:trimethylamine--corrinoid protein Co-methyltransferase